MSDIPKRADNAIQLLEGLINQLHYFYGEDRRFKTDVLKDAIEIENTLKEHAINKKDTIKRIAKRYEEYFRKKQDAVNSTVVNADDTKLNDSIRSRYKHDFKEDRT